MAIQRGPNGITRVEHTEQYTPPDLQPLDHLHNSIHNLLLVSSDEDDSDPEPPTQPPRTAYVSHSREICQQILSDILYAIAMKN